MFKSLAKRLRSSRKPRFNLILEGTFCDEMDNSYLQLSGLEIPLDIGVIEEPSTPVISPKIMKFTGEIGIDRYEESTQYRLIGKTKDFQFIEEVNSRKYKKLSISQSLCNIGSSFKLLHIWHFSTTMLDPV